MCVRNTKLEDTHAGISPVCRTGDYSDVTVIDADGRRIPWPAVSHFDSDTMRAPMRQIVDFLYTFQVKAGNPHFQAIMERWAADARGWRAPKLDKDFMKAIEARRASADGGTQ